MASAAEIEAGAAERGRGGGARSRGLRLRLLAVAAGAALALACLAAPAIAGGAAPAPIGQPADPAPLWGWREALLQSELERGLARLGLAEAARQGRLAAALVDLTEPGTPRVAAVNGDRMMYAASLPKIAILLAAFERIAAGWMELDGEVARFMLAMIRSSSNPAATALIDRIGFPFIARVLSSPRYRLYDATHGGGLWVGKAYARDGLWRRDPLAHVSHGATAMQVARFYYLLDAGRLVSPRASRIMKRILGATRLDHKFARGLRRLDPSARLYRKSGSWRDWHSDSALVERAGRRYVAVALCHDPAGRRWLERLIVAFDRAVFRAAALRRTPAGPVGPPPARVALAPR